MKIYKKIIVSEKSLTEETTLLKIIGQHVKLSNEKIKEVLKFGGVWMSHLKHKNRPRLRVRRAKKEVKVNDVIEFYYDDKIFGQMKASSLEESPYLIKEGKDFSCWYKPPFVLTQGNNYGDEGSLLRFVEKEKGETFLIHRIDREVSGIVIFAHNKKMAKTLSLMLQERSIRKFYVAYVEGNFEENELGKINEVNQKIEGKEAITRFRVLQQSPIEERSYLLVEILTGRKHQIRNHLAGIGHPIVGDYFYGKKSNQGDHHSNDKRRISLWAYRLDLDSPYDSRKRIDLVAKEEESWPIEVKSYLKSWPDRQAHP